MKDFEYIFAKKNKTTIFQIPKWLMKPCKIMQHFGCYYKRISANPYIYFLSSL